MKDLGQTAREWPLPPELPRATSTKNRLPQVDFHHLAIRQGIVRHIMRAHGLRQKHAKDLADWLLSLMDSNVERFR